MKIIPTTYAHLALFMVDITLDDAMEFAHAFPERPRLAHMSEMLNHLLDEGTHNMVTMVDNCDRVCAVGGHEDDGQVWFMTAHKAQMAPVGFIRCIKKYAADRLQDHPVLYNKVWKGNTAHMAFLNAIGVQWGPEDGIWRPFTLTKETIKCAC